MKMQSSKQVNPTPNTSDSLPLPTLGHAASDAPMTIAADLRHDPEKSPKERLLREFLASRLPRHKAPQSLLEKIRRPLD